MADIDTQTQTDLAVRVQGLPEPEENSTLGLKIDKKVLADRLKTRIEDSEKHYEAIGIYKRQKENLKALKGKITDEDFSKLKDHQTKWADNIIWEAENTIKPIVTSRMPDLTVKPGNETQQSKDTAKQISEILNSDIRKREIRRSIGVAIKQHPVYLLACIKAVWDQDLGEEGDYRFIVVHPDNIVIDKSAKNTNVNEIPVIAEKVKFSLKEWLRQHPKGKDILIAALGYDSETYKQHLDDEITCFEVWFDDYEGDDPIQGVAWMYNGKIFDISKNPLFDYEGEGVLNGNTAILQQRMLEMMMSGNMGSEMLEEEIVYRNYFEQPKKPYILIGYDQMGDSAYDFTSRIEQVKYMQDAHNDEGGRINDMLKKSRGIDVVSTDSGMKKAEIEEIDFDDPEMVLVVKGDAKKVHTRIPGEQPNQALFADKDNNKQAIFSKMGTNSTTRGEVSTDVATVAQISRESDFGRLDDYAEETINYVCEQIAMWSMHFIKLFYTKEHMRRILGANGETTHAKITGDMVEDGMEVVVSASATDKLRRTQEAKEEAKLKLIDPLTYMEDTGKPNPKERVERLMTFMTNPEMYLETVVRGKSMEEMAMQLNANTAPTAQPQDGAIQSLV